VVCSLTAYVTAYELAIWMLGSQEFQRQLRPTHVGSKVDLDAMYGPQWLPSRPARHTHIARSAFVI
jgi:hypothetical protein